MRCPTLWRTWRASRITSYPATDALPAVGFRIEVNIRTVVVLPAPFGPSKASTSLSFTVKLSELTAIKSPNCFVNPSARISSVITRDYTNNIDVEQWYIKRKRDPFIMA